MKSRDAVLSAILAGLLVLLLGFIQDGGVFLPDEAVERPESLRDIRLEWVSERAVLQGVDMSTPFDEMAAAIGHPELTTAFTYQPRLPGGVLVNAWIAVAPAGRVLSWMLAVVAVATAVFIYQAQLVMRRTIPILVVPFLFVTDTAAALVWHRGTSWLVTICLLACWLQARRGDYWQSGLVLSFAATLRLWPLVVLPALWFAGRRRAAVAAVVGVLSLNALGLLLPGTSIAASLTTFRQPIEHIDSVVNGSITGLVSNLGLSAVFGLALSLLLLLSAVWWVRFMPFDRAFGVLVAVGLLAAPTAWQHYRSALVPQLISPFGWIAWIGEFAGFVGVAPVWIVGTVTSTCAAAIWSARRTPPSIGLNEPIPE